MAKKSEDASPENERKEEMSPPARRDTCPVPKGILLAAGGSENKGENPERETPLCENENFVKYGILNRFVDELKGSNPTIAVIPTASTIPEEMGRDYKKVFAKIGKTKVEVLDIRTREDANRPEVLEVVRKANGFWFTGGNQLRLTAILGGTPLLHILKERYTYEPIVIGGTSAGATAMSTPMIYEDRFGNGIMKGEVRMTCGLEFIKDIAIDTHFISRGRFVRIAQVISTNPTHLGLGIEEDTGVVITEGQHLEVIGSGLVTVVDGHDSTFTNIYEVKENVPITVRDLRVHLLSQGQRYNINRQDSLHR